MGDVCGEDVAQDTNIEHHILVDVIDSFAEVEDWHESEGALDTTKREGEG